MVRGELLGKANTEGTGREWGMGEGHLKRETKKVERDQEEQTRFPRELGDLRGKGGSQY